MRSGKDFVADAIFDRAYQRGFASGGAQHGVEQECRGGLAVGAGNAGDAQLFRRTAVKVRAESGQRAASALDLRPGNAIARRSRIADHRNRPGPQRVVNVLIAVGGLTAHGDETPARLDAPAVVIQTRDFGIALLGEIFHPIQQFEECHPACIIATHGLCRWREEPGVTRDLARSASGRLGSHFNLPVQQCPGKPAMLESGGSCLHLIIAPAADRVSFSGWLSPCPP